MVNLGKQDAMVALENPTNAVDHMQFYSLKKTQPEFMKEIDWEQFLARKEAGEFQDSGANLEQYQSLFLQ